MDEDEDPLMSLLAAELQVSTASRGRVMFGCLDKGVRV
jgi:hypothetical protein